MDIGGTSSRGRLSENGRVIADFEGPGANVATLDPELVKQRLTFLLAELGSAQPAVCCVGAAGAEVTSARARLERLIQALLPATQVIVVHDSRLVLAAAELESGIALIAGTGSVAYGRTETGLEVRRGGWGWMLGDEGSAAWITREAAREVMRRADNAEALGPLAEALFEACSVTSALELTAKFHAMREPSQWAALAGAVFACVDTDSGAGSVVRRASTELAGLVRAVGACLHLEGPVVLAGGLLLNEPALEAAVRKELGVPCERLDEPPVHGAVRLAEELLAR